MENFIYCAVIFITVFALQIIQIIYKNTVIKTSMTQVLIIQKPIHWFALQITGFCMIETFLMKKLNNNTHIDMHQSCRRRSLTQNTWYQTRYFEVDFDGNRVFYSFFSLVLQRSTFNLEKNKNICKVKYFVHLVQVSRSRYSGIIF